MPTITPLSVRDLKIDLQNYRTVPQKKEVSAIHALISVKPDYFWALAHSLLDDGYHGTENILVLRGGKKGADLIVKEGNRRIGALKIILGYISRDSFDIPTDLEKKIASLPAEWKTTNESVPCSVHEAAEASAVDRLVRLTHAKGESAGRLKWSAVARARYNRDEAGNPEPALDILEKFLGTNQNISGLQRERWGGDYPISVLLETLQKMAPRFGISSAKEIVDQYPKSTKTRGFLDAVLLDVGLGLLDFPALRDVANDFGTKYGIPPLPAPKADEPLARPTEGNAEGSGSPTDPKAHPSARPKTKAVSAKDPIAVKRALRKFQPQGPRREKVVTLLEEARQLNLAKHPHSFCFLLRSMFELSAKAYCADHKGALSPTKDGKDKDLGGLLREIGNHLTKANTDKAMVKQLHGAMSQLNTPTGFLSVTSMNQLIHNPNFIIDETHIAGLFHNVFPLLEAMND